MQGKSRRSVRRAQGEPTSIASIRSLELGKLFRDRYGIELPDDDAGREDLRVLLDVLACRPKARKLMESAVSLWAPWMPQNEAEEGIYFAMANMKYATADEIAGRLTLTDTERTRLRIRTIGSVDVPRAARVERRKQRQREAARQRRVRQKQAQQARETRAMSIRDAYVDKLWDAIKDGGPKGLIRIMAVRGALNSFGTWVTDRQMIDEVCQYRGFADLSPSALRQVVHRAINQLVVHECAVKHASTSWPFPTLRGQYGRDGQTTGHLDRLHSLR
jgi:hypothetical protein